MASIELRPELRPGSERPDVRVLVDGRDLADLAREVELQAATAEGHPQIAGSYRGLAPAQWTTPERFPDGRVALFRCECGEVECWPLLVRVTRTDATVTWSDFGQPHRAAWRYDALGPFVFSAHEYDAAIAGLATG
jgi:hypothetical protein